MKNLRISRESLVSSREFFKGNNLARSAHNSLVTSNKLLVTRIAFTMADRLSRFYNGLMGLRSAFTMAEILLSLTIIGVVAAITLPSLTGNINERTWNTQKKALYARMSQAVALMPSLNNYGSTLDNHAETFISNGLSKVLKINNICGPDNALYDCGFQSKIINAEGAKIDLPKNMQSLNAGIITNNSPVSLKNTKAAAFETANGESVLVFYNPECKASNVLIPGTNYSGAYSGYYIKQQVCANFIFDLNGKKGPNTLGKDIGTMTVVYSSDSKVVMPLNPKGVEGALKFQPATEACRNLGDGQYRLPNIEELLGIYFNRSLYGDAVYGSQEMNWSGTTVDSTTAYGFGRSYGIKYAFNKTSKTNGVICVER